MKVYKCTKCGKEEEPLKFMRAKTFLCADCTKDRKDVEEICNDTAVIDKEQIKEYLLEKNYLVSATGIPYKQYGKHRIALSKTCNKPLLIVRYLDEMTPYTDSSILKYIPEEAIIDLKKVINTIEVLWQK